MYTAYYIYVYWLLIFKKRVERAKERMRKRYRERIKNKNKEQEKEKRWKRGKERNRKIEKNNEGKKNEKRVWMCRKKPKKFMNRRFDQQAPCKIHLNWSPNCSTMQCNNTYQPIMIYCHLIMKTGFKIIKVNYSVMQ